MNVFEYFISNYGMEIIGVILVAILGSLGYGCKKIYESVIIDETKRHIASAAVEFVEQAWKILHGEDKLWKALETAQMLMEMKGLEFDADEMTVMIEAALAEFNGVFHQVKAAAAPENGDTEAEE